MRRPLRKWWRCEKRIIASYNRILSWFSSSKDYRLRPKVRRFWFSICRVLRTPSYKKCNIKWSRTCSLRILSKRPSWLLISWVVINAKHLSIFLSTTIIRLPWMAFQTRSIFSSSSRWKKKTSAHQLMTTSEGQTKLLGSQARSMMMIKVSNKWCKKM